MTFCNKSQYSANACIWIKNILVLDFLHNVVMALKFNYQSLTQF